MFFQKKEKLNINTLRSAFDAQKKILIEKGYLKMHGITLESFNDTLESLWKVLLEKNEHLEIKIFGDIPLLLVPQQCGLPDRIKMINGHTELNITEIEESQQSELNPFYLVLDVEDGRKMVAKSAKDSLNKFKKENRSALNINESLALLTYYPEILKNHYLITAGTFYKKDGENLPLLWLLDEDHNPELHYAWFDIAHGSYGAGSYAIKII
jgi:GTPase SAR1 family protein